MSNHTIPSRLKGLSFAVAQVIAVASATDVVADASCSHQLDNASPSVVIGADTTGAVCDREADAKSVTLSSGVTLTGADTFVNAISVKNGVATVTLESGAGIVNQQSRYSYGMDLGDLSTGGDIAVTLDANATITVTADSATTARARAAAINAVAKGEVTIDLSAGSAISGTATAHDSYAEGAGIFVDASYSSADDSVVITAAESTISASASGVAARYHKYDHASSVGVQVTNPREVSVDLSASSIKSEATTVSNSGVEGGAGAAGIAIYAASAEFNSGDSLATVLLNGTSLDIDSSIEGDGYGQVVALGVSSDAFSYTETAKSVVTAKGGTIDVLAVSNLASDDHRNTASATAIAAGAVSYTQYDTSAAVTLNSGAKVSSKAFGANANATGVVVRGNGHYSLGTATVTLSDASLDVTAEGYGSAVAYGIVGAADTVNVNLTDADIALSVIKTGSAKGGAVAHGINVRGDSLDVTLTNSSVVVDVSSPAYAGGYATGISLGGYDAAAAVTLNGSSVVVNAPDSGVGLGVLDASGREYGAVITLDSGSRIEADLAVYSEGVHAQLLNAGRIVGDIDSRRGLVDTTGTIIGHVVAETLEVRDQGIVAGKADVTTLNVAAGGELQVILTDEVHSLSAGSTSAGGLQVIVPDEADRNNAHFSAVDATFADGSKVHLNATSELYSPDVDGISYLVVNATNSLIANTDAMLLNTSGLISAGWVECGPLSLCVSVRALELEEVAIGDGSSANGVDAAGAAQSVLEELSGTDTAETFLALIERVVDDEAWEELDGSGQGENLLASRDAERVVSRYVQRLMQQGRSSGEEFSAAQGLWVQALQTDGDGDSDNGVAGFEVDTTGFAIGYDRELRPGLVIGGVISSADTEVESDDNMNRVDTDSLMASVYGQWTQGPLFANAVMTYGRGDNDSRRNIVGDIATADYDSDFLSLRIQGGKEFGFESGWKLSPRVEVAYNHVNIDSYDETGSIAALSVASQSYETLELGLGLEIAKPIIIDKAVWTPYFDLAVYHDFADDQVQSNSRFVIGGNSFVTTGSDVEQTNVSATLGLSYAVGANQALKVAYEYLGNSSYNSASWMLRYSYGF